MSDSTPTFEERPLTFAEERFIRWLLEHDASAPAVFLSQLPDVRVVSECECGCASLDFIVDGVEPQGTNLQAMGDYDWLSADGSRFGVYVSARGGLLASLELWSIDGLAACRGLPAIEDLRPATFEPGE